MIDVSSLHMIIQRFYTGNRENENLHTEYTYSFLMVDTRFIWQSNVLLYKLYILWAL